MNLSGLSITRMASKNMKKIISYPYLSVPIGIGTLSLIAMRFVSIYY